MTGHQFFAINSPIKNLHHATPDAVIFQLSPSKIHHATPDALIFQSSPRKMQSYVRKSQPATYVKHKVLSGRAKGNALLSSYDYSYNNPGPSPTIRKFHKPPLSYFKQNILSSVEQLYLEPGYYNSWWQCQTATVHKTNFKNFITAINTTSTTIITNVSVKSTTSVFKVKVL